MSLPAAKVRRFPHSHNRQDMAFYIPHIGYMPQNHCKSGIKRTATFTLRVAVLLRENLVAFNLCLRLRFVGGLHDVVELFELQAFEFCLDLSVRSKYKVDVCDFVTCVILADTGGTL